MYTLLAALGFAAVSTLTSIATGAGVALLAVLMWRYVLSSVVLVGYVGTRGYPRMRWNEASKFLFIGGIGQATFVWMALSSLAYVPVATLAFLFYTYPMWVALVQVVRRAEPLTTRRGVALALSFGGIAVIVGAPSGGIPWPGLALALGAALVYGAYIPTMQLLQKHHPVPLTSALAKIGTAGCFFLLAFVNGVFTYELPSVAWEAIAALTILSTVLPSVFFLMGLIRLGAVRTAIVSTVEPFLTAILGAVVLGQGVAPSVIGGGAMIIAAVVVLQARRERVA